MSKRCLSSVGPARGLSVVLLGLMVAVSPLRCMAASGPDETLLDAVALGQMELRADHAVAHDQCYLYTELLHGLTELAGRQMAAGQDDEAQVTMRQVEAITLKIEAATGKDTRRLKNVEQLLEHTSRRLADMVHSASDEQRTVMQATLKHLNAVHTNVLAMVFAH